MTSGEVKLSGKLTKELVLELSKRKKDPAWMRDFRLRSLETYNQMPLPNWGPKLDGLDVDHIASYVRSTGEMVDDWQKVPTDIRQTFEDLGIPEAERAGLAGVGAQYDSELVYHNVKKAVAKSGVVYMGIEEALRSKKYGKMVQDYFMKLVPPSDHKFAALHGAVWSGGSFVYIPKNVSVEFPLQSYFRFNAPGAGQFEHTLIIADEGSSLHFIEGCSAPKYNVANLHAGCVEIFVKKHASVKYSTVENWSKNMYNLNTKRAMVETGGKIEWITGSFGSHVSMLYPMGILNGVGATMEYTGVSFAAADQDLDTGVKVVHNAAKTHSYILAKSLAKNGGKNTFRSLIVATKKATKSRSFMNCQTLMLDGKSESATIPTFNIAAADADIAHEASVGKINEHAIDFLTSRGISREHARGLIVRGFTTDVSKQLPMEYAVEMNNLIQLEMRKAIA